MSPNVVHFSNSVHTNTRLVQNQGKYLFNLFLEGVTLLSVLHINRKRGKSYKEQSSFVDNPCKSDKFTRYLSQTRKMSHIPWSSYLFFFFNFFHCLFFFWGIALLFSWTVYIQALEFFIFWYLYVKILDIFKIPVIIVLFALKELIIFSFSRIFPWEGFGYKNGWRQIRQKSAKLW